MSEPTKVADEDLLRVIEYLDGELAEDAALAFEVRLSQEPDLAASVESFERMDVIERLARVQPSKPLLPFPRWVLYAASVAAAIGLILWTRSAAHRLPQARVAVLENANNVGDYRRLLGLDPLRLPPGYRMRGSSDAEEVSVGEYLSEVGAAESRRTDAALDEGPRPIQAACFTVVFRPELDCAAVLVAIDAKGDIERLYPPSTNRPAAANRFEAGTLCVLPRASSHRMEDPESGEFIDHDPGFFMPLGAGRLTLLLGLRAEAVNEELLQEIDETDSDEAAADRVEARRLWLRERGFEVTELHVLEPD